MLELLPSYLQQYERPDHGAERARLTKGSIWINLGDVVAWGTIGRIVATSMKQSSGIRFILSLKCVVRTSRYQATVKASPFPDLSSISMYCALVPPTVFTTCSACLLKPWTAVKTHRLAVGPRRSKCGDFGTSQLAHRQAINLNHRAGPRKREVIQ